MNKGMIKNLALILLIGIGVFAMVRQASELKVK
jgi:hypothetical protein